MKKNCFVVPLAAVAALFVSSCGVQKQVPVSNDSAVQAVPAQTPAASGKTRAQELREEGYKPAGVSFTLSIEEILDDFNSKLLSGKYMALEANAEATDQKSTAQSMALTIAAADYATQAATRVKGTLTREFGDKVGSDETYSNILGKFGMIVGETVVPLLEPKASFYREKDVNGKHIYEVVVMYLIDKEKTADLEEEAMKKAVSSEVTEIGLQNMIFDHINKMNFGVE